MCENSAGNDSVLSDKTGEEKKSMFGNIFFRIPAQFKLLSGERDSILAAATVAGKMTTKISSRRFTKKTEASNGNT